jgi:hypothetical protein
MGVVATRRGQWGGGGRGRSEAAPRRPIPTHRPTQPLTWQERRVLLVLLHVFVPRVCHAAAAARAAVPPPPWRALVGRGLLLLLLLLLLRGGLLVGFRLPVAVPSLLRGPVRTGMHERRGGRRAPPPLRDARDPPAAAAGAIEPGRRDRYLELLAIPNAAS